MVEIKLGEEELKKAGIMKISVFGHTPLIPYAVVQIPQDRGEQAKKDAENLVSSIKRKLEKQRGINGIAFSDVFILCTDSNGVVSYCTIAVLNPSEKLIENSPIITYWSMSI